MVKWLKISAFYFYFLILYFFFLWGGHKTTFLWHSIKMYTQGSVLQEMTLTYQRSGFFVSLFLNGFLFSFSVNQIRTGLFFSPLLFISIEFYFLPLGLLVEHSFFPFALFPSRGWCLYLFIVYFFWTPNGDAFNNHISKGDKSPPVEPLATPGAVLCL